jgi:L-gulonolactone oxidase
MVLWLLSFVFFLLSHPSFSVEWTNWGNTQHCSPQKILFPKTLEDVQEIIHDAAKNRIPLKAIGSGHSWSDLVCTSGYLINTDSLDKIIWIDAQKCRIKVQAGIKLKTLIKELAKNGLTLSNQGFITEQSIAGAIATATHGTGKAFSLSDYIIGMEIIDSNGNLYEISDTIHSEWLPYTRVALGALGLVYTVTIQCEPLYNVKHSRKLHALNQIVEQYSHLYDAHDFFMFMYKPHGPDALVFTWDRTSQPVNTYYTNYILNDLLFHKFLNYAAITMLSRYKTVSSACLELGLSGLQMNEHVEYAHISLSPIKTPLGVQWYIEEEIAIPFEEFPCAFEKLNELYAHYDPSGTELISMVTCRFGPATKRSFLNPCFGRKTAYITINIMNYFDNYEQFFKDFEALMEPYQGRPHWGKFHYLDKSKIEKLYGTQTIAKFNQLRAILDPYSLWTNDFVQRCLV